MKGFGAHDSTDAAAGGFLKRCQVKEAFRVFSKSLVSFWRLVGNSLLGLERSGGMLWTVCVYTDRQARPCNINSRF